MGCDVSKPGGGSSGPTTQDDFVVIGSRGSGTAAANGGANGGGGADLGVFKIVVLGNVAVGKTSLMRRFVDGQFDAEHAPTVPASFRKVVVGLGPDHNDRQVTLSVWDTAGQERFHQALGKGFYRKATLGVFVYDVSDPLSLVNVKKWVDLFKQFGPLNAPGVLLGNKSDLRNHCQEEQLEAVMENAKRENGKPFFLFHQTVSAKNGQGLAKAPLEAFPQVALACTRFVH